MISSKPIGSRDSFGQWLCYRRVVYCEIQLILGNVSYNKREIALVSLTGSGKCSVHHHGLIDTEHKLEQPKDIFSDWVQIDVIEAGSCR